MRTRSRAAARTAASVGTWKRTLWAVSDLHINAPGNRDVVAEHVRPRHPEDWLIVAGDVAEDEDTVLGALRGLADRFATVIWVPGNHELYSRSQDKYKGKAKYDYLVANCRRLGVLTPEDPYVSFAGHTLVPLFTLYDHSWRSPDVAPADAIAEAEQKGRVLTDHYTIAPFVDITLWCRERLRYSVRRLSHVEGSTILINHWPLVREVMDNVQIPEIALWSGTRHTQTWPKRYKATTVIYGHLHIPVEHFVDHVTHAEVSLGYPRERERTLSPRITQGMWPYPVLTEEVNR
ncbi:metallophosphoesterase family protein [Corynebacterium anserum]|uniref:Metallophosphoesterase n=1 Tax=Corynebacterium anserum TaxID=2684406 RepID=A0A7G7YR42_9CORY|nr:metallophosphoesterase [Corynebacterium anserum]MBC2681739.1 metallophosphoesterase [Corynebacterium anserum]QNH96962.1 metallophosphoesterase [Corynebacterium anserum]